MKYVMIRANIGDGLRVDLPVIFPGVLNHVDVSQRMQHLIRFEHKWINPQPVSAGFLNCRVMVEGGKSETLSLGPLKDDEAHINMIDYNAGVRL